MVAINLSAVPAFAYSAEQAMTTFAWVAPLDYQTTRTDNMKQIISVLAATAATLILAACASTADESASSTAAAPNSSSQEQPAQPVDANQPQM